MPLKNHEFLLKNGRLLCNSRYPDLLSPRQEAWCGRLRLDRVVLLVRRACTAHRKEIIRRCDRDLVGRPGTRRQRGESGHACAACGVCTWGDARMTRLLRRQIKCAHYDHVCTLIEVKPSEDCITHTVCTEVHVVHACTEE